MSHETTQRISAARARRLLGRRRLPAPRTCATVRVLGPATAPYPAQVKRVVSICNEPEKGGLLLDTDDREWRP